MRFFISWYPGDPNYAEQDADCAMLISVTSVPRIWRLSHFSPAPKYIMIDSGGFRYAMTGTSPPSPKAVFAQQMAIIEDIDYSVSLCALDYPVLPDRLSLIEQDRAIHRTLANAYEFKQLTENHPRRGQIIQMAIVQGHDLSTLKRCARELQAIGFDHYGIGSMAHLYKPQEIIARIQAVSDVLGQGIHIFGVSGIRAIKAMQQAGVQSMDSTTPVTGAKYNQIFYSDPFRRYIIADGRSGRDPDRSGERISEALPCDCCVCQGRANPELLLYGKRRYVYLRSLHNYHHLKQEIMRQSLA
jgi:7-cyano-7-deazaguanine tRNA-ribosyltransferase